MTTHCATPHNLVNFMCPFLLTDVTVLPVYMTIYTEDCLQCTSLAVITSVFINSTQHHICKFKSSVPIGVFDLMIYTNILSKQPQLYVQHILG